MRVSPEWAKQLLHGLYGSVPDYANMEVCAVEDYPYYCIFVHDDTLLVSEHYDPEYPIPSVETVESRKVADGYNREVTRLAYSFRANKLLVGSTYAYGNVQKPASYSQN